MWVLGLALVIAGVWIALRQTLAPNVAVAVVETEVVRELPVEVGPWLAVHVELPRPEPGAAPVPCPPIDAAVGGIYRGPGGRRFAPGGDPPAVLLTSVVASPTRANLMAGLAEGGRIYLSRDGGRSFSRVLAHRGELRDHAFGCAGELYALRGRGESLELGVHGAGGDRWRRLRLGRCQGDVKSELALYGGGGWLAIAVDHWGCDQDGGMHTLWVSPDRGASWRLLPIPEAQMVEGIRVLELRADRVRIAAYEGDCMYDGTVLYDLDPRTGAVLRAGATSRHDQQRAIETRGRWGYAERGCDGLLCKARLDGPTLDEGDDTLAWTSLVRSGAADDDAEPFLLAGPRHIYASDGAHLYTLSRGVARDLGPVPDGIDFRDVDLAGSLLGITRTGRLVRFSARHGLRALASPQAP